MRVFLWYNLGVVHKGGYSFVPGVFETLNNKEKRKKKMKNYKRLALILMACVFVAGCSDKNNEKGNSSNETGAESGIENTSGTETSENMGVVEFDSSVVNVLTKWQGTNEFDSSLFKGTSMEFADKLNNKQYIITENEDGTYLYYKLDHVINSDYFMTRSNFTYSYNFFLNQNSLIELAEDMRYLSFWECVDCNGTKEVIDLEIVTNVSYITEDKTLINTIGKVAIYEDGEYSCELLVRGKKTNLVVSVDREKAEDIARILDSKVGLTQKNSEIVSNGVEVYDFMDYYIYTRFGVRESDTYKFASNDFQDYNLVNIGNEDDYIITLVPYEVKKVKSGKDVKTLEIAGKELNYFVIEDNKYTDRVTMYIESPIEEGICMSLSRYYNKSEYPTQEEQVEDLKRIVEEFIKE